MKEAEVQFYLRRLLLTMIFVLTFEGIVRKLQIPGTSIPIFALKDVLCVLLGIFVLRMRRAPGLDFLLMTYLGICVLFIPTIMATTIHDPILAIFGIKQYLLYPVVAFAMFQAFHDATPDEIVRFFRIPALLVIPTVLIALYEMRLPNDHWLNRSVEGDDISAFSAGGELRVSSTFSFVAQFGIFLNAQFFIVTIALTHMRGLSFFWKLAYLLLVPLLVIGSYITGSRGAVVGNMAMICIAGGLAMAKFQFKALWRVGIIIAGILATIALVQHFNPGLFAAYSAREEGQMIGVSKEIQGRLYGAFFDWINQAYTTPFLGYGLGVMTNGSDLISSYAARYRDLGTWTETDMATTVFEGGFYLVFVWYSFRFIVIAMTALRYLFGTRGEMALPAAFSQAYVILFGITGTLGIQPPMAIWFWMAVGTSLLLWWKCVGPQAVEKDLEPPAPVKPRLPRGRSAYAERLHGRHGK